MKSSLISNDISSASRKFIKLQFERLRMNWDGNLTSVVFSSLPLLLLLIDHWEAWAASLGGRQQYLINSIYIPGPPHPAAEYLRRECQNYLQTGQGPLLYNQWRREHLKTRQIITLNGPANAKSICISLSVALTLTTLAIFNESALYCSGREVGPGSILSNQTILVKNDERYFRSIVVNIQYLYWGLPPSFLLNRDKLIRFNNAHISTWKNKIIQFHFQ